MAVAVGRAKFAHPPRPSPRRPEDEALTQRVLRSPPARTGSEGEGGGMACFPQSTPSLQKLTQPAAWSVPDRFADTCTDARPTLYRRDTDVASRPMRLVLRH